MKRDWNAMAQGILDAVGGPENISGMTHCATRLRLNLKDDAACDDAAVKGSRRRCEHAEQGWSVSGSHRH